MRLVGEALAIEPPLHTVSLLGGREPPKVVPGCLLLESFKPIESIIDGLPTGRGALVSITAPTGHGKTTVSALMEVALCRGSTFAGRDVTQGSVLVLAGENPDDYIMHLKATLQDQGLVSRDVNRVNSGQLLVIPGTFSIDYEIDYLRERIKALYVKLVAVFVDTSAAFYTAADENSNVDMRRHASMLRELTGLPGDPTVFVLCHPVKTAQRDSLLPRGGGAFLAEVDANLTLWKDDAGIVSLHWCGKIRGPSFDPVRFELAQVELDGVKDVRGRPIFSVAARHIPDERAEQLEAKALGDENTLLIAMRRKPQASLAELSLACGWASGAGTPNKARVHRLLQTLKAHGLVEKNRSNVWCLTAKGRKEVDDL